MQGSSLFLWGRSRGCVKLFFFARPPAVLSHRAKSKTRAKALKDSQMSDQCSISMSMSICARPARPRRDTGAHCAVDALTLHDLQSVGSIVQDPPPRPPPAPPALERPTAVHTTRLHTPVLMETPLPSISSNVITRAFACLLVSRSTSSKDECSVGAHQMWQHPVCLPALWRYGSPPSRPRGYRTALMPPVPMWTAALLPAPRG